MCRTGVRQNRSIFLYVCVFVFSAIIMTGCGSAKIQNEPGPARGQTSLRLSPGDTIEIKFPYADQFNETETIRPDGKITLPLVGEVHAAGKTPAELQEQLVRLHSSHLQHPELAVIVRSLYDRKVYVGGAVIAPGMIEMPGRLTALEAIMQAGGFDLESAHLDSVILIHYNNGRPIAEKLELEDAVEGGEYTPVYLEPKDVVYVPRTTIVEVDQWVKQHIYDLLPIGGIGFGYSID